LEKRRVVTSFLEREGKILLLKRSSKVGTYKGRWAGVSGYVDDNEELLHAALREIEEETELPRNEVKLLRAGKLLPIPDATNNILWLVKPYLFRIHTDKIRVDWEHQEYRWIKPEDLEGYETVPMLGETLERVMELHPKPVILDSEVMEGSRRIISDRTHGATWLAGEALRVAKLASERCEATDVGDYVRYLKVVIDELMRTRASMAPLTSSLSLLFHDIDEASKAGSLSQLKTLTASKVEALTMKLKEAMFDTAKYASQLIKDGDTVMTHSYSSTILEALREAFQQGKHFKTVITESRPLFEGRITAKELSKLGVPVELIVDSTAAYFVSSVDKVLVGADSVLADGSIINKAGTYSIALAAKDSGVSFYAATQKVKYDVRSYLGEKVTLEEKDSSEVWEETVLGVKVRNLYFDVTPASYLSGIVTEDGMVKPEEMTTQIEAMLPHMYLG